MIILLVLSWFISPVLAGITSVALYMIVDFAVLRRVRSAPDSGTILETPSKMWPTNAAYLLFLCYCILDVYRYFSRVFGCV